MQISLKRVILILIFIVCFSDTSSARDALGGNIWYEFVGDSLSPYRYDVYIEMYYLGLGGFNTFNRQLCISSSCFQEVNVQANFVGVYDQNSYLDSVQGSFNGSILPPYHLECVDSSLYSKIVFSEIHLFKATVTLPGKCHNFKFASTGTGRGSYDNLIFGSALYLYANLDNTGGPNSSPRFLWPAAKSYCTGYQFQWPQTAFDSDGDSLHYQFNYPIDGSLCNNSYRLSYAPGYSRNQPITSSNGVTLNSRTGIITFKPVKQENVVFNIEVTEYRKLAGIWKPIGKLERGVQLSIVNLCNPKVMYGPRLDTNIHVTVDLKKDSVLGFNVNNAVGVDSAWISGRGRIIKSPTIEYSCYDSTITLKFTSGVLCASIAEDGSDFRLIGPDSVPIPIIKYSGDCDREGFTRKIDLKLHQCIDRNGAYMLFVKNGNDGNTLVGRCGFQMPDFSIIVLKAAGCLEPSYKLLQVSVEKDQKTEINWEADSLSYHHKLFNAWQIERALEGSGDFYKVGAQHEHWQRTFTDTGLSFEDYDLASFKYRIRLMQNHRLWDTTEHLRTILLTYHLPDSTNDTRFSFEWTAYNAWDSTDYTFSIGRPSTVPGSEPRWVKIKGPQHNFFDMDYQFPEVTSTSQFIYMAKVEATNPVWSSDSLSSESNWVYIRFYYIPPEPDKTPEIRFIPNVFTPNGDGSNDFFTIDTDYQQSSVTIYNRWGKPVFEYQGLTSDLAWDGTDFNNNQQLADGVYFYVAKFSSSLDDGFGNFSEVSETMKGNITLLSVN